jgi:2-dehydropantoate 2-reductase
MNVVLMGCGRLGGVMAVRLAGRPGLRLTVLNRNPEIGAAAASRGLQLRWGRRRVTALPRMVAQPRELPSPVDLVILATSSPGLVDAAGTLLPFLGKEGVFVTTQNGLVALELVRTLGSERVVPGCVLWGAAMDRPGEYRLTAGGYFLIGPLDEAVAEGTGRGGPRPARLSDRAAQRLRPVAEVLGRAFPVHFRTHMRGVLWSKLAISACFTTLGAITGLRFGELARRRRLRSLILAMGQEVREVARAEGVKLQPLGPGMDVERLLSERGYATPLRHLLVRAVGHRHRRTESGMLSALRRGRETEIEFINGVVVRLAARHGLEAPLNRTAVQTVKAMEAGRLQPGPANLEVFFH